MTDFYTAVATIITLIAACVWVFWRFERWTRPHKSAIATRPQLKAEWDTTIDIGPDAGWICDFFGCSDNVNYYVNRSDDELTEEAAGYALFTIYDNVDQITPASSVRVRLLVEGRGDPVKLFEARFVPDYAEGSIVGVLLHPSELGQETIINER